MHLRNTPVSYSPIMIIQVAVWQPHILSLSLPVNGYNSAPVGLAKTVLNYWDMWLPCKLVPFPGIKYLYQWYETKKHSVINRPGNILIFLFCFLFARPAVASMPMPAPVGESKAKIKVNAVDNLIINQSFKSDKKDNNNDRHWFTSILTIAQY